VHRQWKKLLRSRVLWILVGLACIFGFLSFNPVLGTGGDNTCYILLSKALAMGKGYVRIYEPGNPPETHFPMGYPLLLAPITKIFGINIIAYKILNTILYIVSVFLLAKLFIREKSQLYVSLLVILNPFVLELASSVLSEIPFMFVNILLFYLLLKKHDNRIIRYVLPIILFYAFLVRSAGIAFIVAVIFYLLLKKNYKYAIYTTIVIIVLSLPLFLRKGPVGGYLRETFLINPYNPDAGFINFLGLIKRVGFNLKEYFLKLIPGCIVPQIVISHLSVIGFLISIFVVIGFIRSIFFRNFYAIFTLFYLGMLMIRPPVWNSMRFIFPVIPFILHFFYEGNVYIVNKLSSKKHSKGNSHRKFPVATYILPVITGIFTFFSAIQHINKATPIRNEYFGGNEFAGYSMDWIRFYQAADWAKSNTPRNAVFICRKPPMFYLRSGRLATNYPLSYDKSKVLAKVFTGDYVLVDHFYWTGTTYKYLIPAIQSAKERFRVVYVTPPPRTYILKILKQK